MGLFVLFSPDPWERWKSWAERRQEDAAKLQAPKMLMNALLKLMSILITAIVLINNSKAKGGSGNARLQGWGPVCPK